MKINKKSGFTFIEILVVIAIIAIISISVVYFLNPSQLQSQGRDTNRLSDMTMLNQNLALYHEVMPAGSLGSSSVLYISIPDPTATTTAGTNCAGLGLPTSTTYHCAGISSYRKTDGTGWVPVNFSSASNVNIPTLPIDPVNTTSSNEYYVYVTNGTQYEILSNPEAQKTINSSASSSYSQGNDLALQPTFPILGSSNSPVCPSSSAQCVYVADTQGPIDVFDTAGNFIGQIGAYTSGAGGGNNGLFNRTQDMTFDASGNFYGVDNSFSYGSIQKFDSTGKFLAVWNPGNGSGNGQFKYGSPSSITTDSSGNIYANDKFNYRIEKFDSNGNYISQFGSTGAGSFNSTNMANNMVFDSSGNMYVSVYNPTGTGSAIEKFDSNGNYITQFSSQGSGNGQLHDPYGMAFDPNGNLWVVDYGNNRVEGFTTSGAYFNQLGSYGTSTGQFNSPLGIAFDASGNMYVTDGSSAGRVQKFAPNGTTGNYTYVTQFGQNASGTFYMPESVKIK